MTLQHGWRKALTVFAFIGPTLLGILIFSVYPILFNTYISFTNRNQYHPNPDCSAGLNSIMEPTCWSVFKKSAPTGMGTPFGLQTPIYKNYADLLGPLFTVPFLEALLVLFICFIPLIIGDQLNKRWDKEIDRPISPLVVTLIAIALGVGLFFILNGSDAINTIINSGDFFTVNWHTIFYVICCIPLFFLVGLSLALLLNVHDLPGRTFFRVVLIVPWAASTVAIMMSLVWKFFFQEQGLLNQLLKLINQPAQIWLQNPTVAFIVIVLVNVWYSYPFFMVTILGALQSIPAELFEAAEMDGASWFQSLENITMPLIRPAVIPVIVLSSITTFQMFGTVWAITQGGPSTGAGTPGATDLVMTFAYKQVFQTNAFGRMGAFAVIIFIMLFIATLYSLRVSRITKGAYE